MRKINWLFTAFVLFGMLWIGESQASACSEKFYRENIAPVIINTELSERGTITGSAVVDEELQEYVYLQIYDTKGNELIRKNLSGKDAVHYETAYVPAAYPSTQLYPVKLLKMDFKFTAAQLGSDSRQLWLTVSSANKDMYAAWEEGNEDVSFWCGLRERSSDWVAVKKALIVEIPDSGLQYAVRKTLNRMEGDIYEKDLESIQKLQAVDRGISDLEGLQYAADMRELDLTYNRLTDISHLKQLTILQGISLRGNRIEDISVLRGLYNLKFVDLRGNPLNYQAASIIRLLELSGVEVLADEAQGEVCEAVLGTVESLGGGIHDVFDGRTIAVPFESVDEVLEKDVFMRLENGETFRLRTGGYYSVIEDDYSIELGSSYSIERLLNAEVFILEQENCPESSGTIWIDESEGVLHVPINTTYEDIYNFAAPDSKSAFVLYQEMSTTEERMLYPNAAIGPSIVISGRLNNGETLFMKVENKNVNGIQIDGGKNRIQVPGRQGFTINFVKMKLNEWIIENYGTQNNRLSAWRRYKGERTIIDSNMLYMTVQSEERAGLVYSYYPVKVDRTQRDGSFVQ